LKFIYKARDVDGKVISGEIDASTPQVAERKLRGEGLYPLSIKPLKKKGLGGDISMPLMKSKVKVKHVAIFTRQLAAMIGAGIPLPTAIDTLSQQVSSKKLAQILTEIREDVEDYIYNSTFPLVLEIPDSRGPLPDRQSISDLIMEAVGISV